MEQTSAYVDDHQAVLLEDLCTLIRQPSVSSTGQGMSDCANLVREMTEASGFDARVIPTACHPRVFGERLVDPAYPTLLLTSHYDVQPPEPLAGWRVPPFSATVTEDRVIGRGATDAKGNLMAILKAVKALWSRSKAPRVNVKVLFDGEEEIGSPTLPDFLREHSVLLKCDALVTFDAGFEPGDRPFVWLGSSGLLALEIEVSGGTKDVHSSKARLVPNAAWRLVWLLSSLKGPDERVLIPGFYDPIRPPHPEEEALLEAMPWDDSAHHRALGVKEFLGQAAGIEAKRRMLFSPACTITGVDGGYTGRGPKETIPHRARAKVEFRLVPDQRPETVQAALTAHLRRIGYEDAQITVQANTEPSQCRLDSPIRHTLERAIARVYGRTPVIRPRHESSGRQGIWMAGRLGVDGAITGIGPSDWNGHAPNEFITRCHFFRGIQYVATVIEEFSRWRMPWAPSDEASLHGHLC